MQSNGKEPCMSRQRFLNQKLGKRMSRKADLRKAKLPAAPRPATRPVTPSRTPR